jgi:hypothetical protein
MGSDFFNASEGLDPSAFFPIKGDALLRSLRWDPTANGSSSDFR